MDQVNASPWIWVAKGAHQRMNNLSSVRGIKLNAGEYGLWVQALTQNIRVTVDNGSTNPVASGNDLGFQIRAGDPPIRLEGRPGWTFNFIQETATAVLQYVSLTLVRQIDT